MNDKLSVTKTGNDYNERHQDNLLQITSMPSILWLYVISELTQVPYELFILKCSMRILNEGSISGLSFINIDFPLKNNLTENIIITLKTILSLDQCK